MSLLVKGIPFKSFGINGKRGGSIYDQHNVCTNCMLKYPKNIYRCSNNNPRCTQHLKARSYTIRARHKLLSEVKRVE